MLAADGMVDWASAALPWCNRGPNSPKEKHKDKERHQNKLAPRRSTRLNGSERVGMISFLGQGRHPPLLPWMPTPFFSGRGLVSVLAAPPGVLPEDRYGHRSIFKNGRRSPVSHPFYSRIQPTRFTFRIPHRINHNAVHPCLCHSLGFR